MSDLEKSDSVMIEMRRRGLLGFTLARALSMPFAHRRIALALWLCLVVLPSAQASTTRRAEAADPNEILFVGSTGDVMVGTDRHALYLVREDGRQTQLTAKTSASIIAPAWSPDGRQFSFTRGGQIYVARADGSGLRQLTRGAATSAEAQWSPNGRLLVYSAIWTKRSDLYVMKADGSEKRRLTTGEKRDGWARWSPDGGRIAFNRYTGKSSHIYVINADGTRLRRLTHGGDLDGGPSWSPDGRQIAFDRFYGGPGQSDLFLMTAAGKSQRKLTNTPNPSEMFPEWSPSSRTIAFLVGTARETRVEVIQSNGSRQRTLARNATEVSSLSWDRAARRITFVGYVGSGPQSALEIHTVGIDETRPTSVTTNELFETTPQWRP